MPSAAFCTAVWRVSPRSDDQLMASDDGEIELVKEYLVEAEILKLQCDGGKEALHRGVGRVEPIAALFVHPECAGIEGERLILMGEGIVWLRESWDAGDDREIGASGQLADQCLDGVNVGGKSRPARRRAWSGSSSCRKRS